MSHPALQHLPIDLPLPQITAFCQANSIRKLSLFGSILRDDFSPTSDVDLLVEFLPGKTPGLAIVCMEWELAECIGRKVDLRTPGDLSRYFRDEVLREAVPIYEQD